MVLKVTVFVEKKNLEKSRKVKANVSRVLATYPDSVLAEVDEKQMESLKKQGFNLAVHGASQKIKLASMEFDTSKLPILPTSLKAVSAAVVDRKEKTYWIIQFVGPINAEWRSKVTALGADLRGYIPENAFLAHMNLKTKEEVEKLPYVNWIGVYEPAYKVSPALMGRKGPMAAEEVKSMAISLDTTKPKAAGNVSVLLHKPEDLPKITKLITDQGGTVVKSEGNTIIASLNQANVEQLAQTNEVSWIEPYERPKLHNDKSAQVMAVQAAWNNHGLTGEDQIVSVSDTGLDTGVNDATMHDDFEGKIIKIYDRVGDGAKDFVISVEGASHGTHVAGSVLGNGSKSNGVLRGMAPSAKLVFQAIGNNTDGSLDGIPADYNLLFQQAYDDGARIHTNSWGDRYHGQYLSGTRTTDEFMWNHKDSIILFSAGNDGVDGNRNGVIDLNSLSSQSCSKNCITVGATEGDRPHGSTPSPGYDFQWGTGSWAAYFPVPPISTDHVSNNPDGMAAFSSRGPTNDGRVKPDVVAPGTNILSTQTSTCVSTSTAPLWGGLPTSSSLKDLYCWSGGTSMSTPLTAGVVALIRQYLKRVYPNNKPSGALLKAILIHGAVPIAGQYNPPEVGPVPDMNQGWGRVSLTGSLFPDYPTYMMFYDLPSSALATGDSKLYSFNLLKGTVPLKVTLVWTDPPKTMAAGSDIVNKLQLSVTKPDGAVVYGTPDVNTKPNNVQQVLLSSLPLATGTYKMKVYGLNVTSAEKQDFALVVSGGLELADLYIRDNPSDTGVPPLPRRLNQSPDILYKIIALNPGYKIQVQVKVHNRGSAKVNQAKVRLYYAIKSSARQRIWPLPAPSWLTAGITINGVPGNEQSLDVPARGSTTDGVATTDEFEISVSATDAINAIKAGKPFGLAATVGLKRGLSPSGVNAWGNDYAAKIPKNTEFP